jgi:hypothetical protein
MLCIPAALLAGAWAAAADASGGPDFANDFADPPLQWHSRPLWFWNGQLDAEKTRGMVAACKDAGYYGMGILPTKDMGVAFMSPEFLDHYQVAADKAAALGMKLCLYDEFWFPSGAAGGLLVQKHPEALSQRLDMLALDVTGPKPFAQAVPAGTFMGAVAMNVATKQRKNISARVKEGQLAWDVPAGDWKVMLFTCVRDGGGGLVNYLSPAAVKCFIALTYQAYYDKFPKHFGTTIDSAFYDEPGLYHVQGGRAWTNTFNDEFKKKFGFDPVICYPALWFDIGPDTAAARNALFGMRAELYTMGFPKTINDWCRTHRIQLTGHVDQEELVNPVIGQSGDMIKAFKYQDIPGIDQIGGYGRASRAYKVVSSAAINYDRTKVVTECYGAMDLPLPNLYREAMDQFAKGINTMVPHAVWYDSNKIVFKPDLTPGAATYGPELPAYNKYIGRLQRLLQGGRHVADIGVLYPIAALQAGSWFGPGNPYEGCVEIPEADYMQVGELLALNVRRDFTFLHPEVLDEKCRVAGAEIQLSHKVNSQHYKVFILPGARAIHWSNLKKIQQFYDQGGKVIATTRLPDTSAEFGKNKQVRGVLTAMFGAAAMPEKETPRVTASSSWAAGGFDPAMATDGNPKTRWNAADGDKNAQWLEVDFGSPKIINRTIVREVFARARAYRIQAWDGAKWNDCVTGQGLGAEKIDRFGCVRASKVRLYIEPLAADSVSISEFSVFDADDRNLVRPVNPIAADLYSVKSNAKGGKAYFIPAPNASTLKTVLDDALKVYDVAFEEEPVLRGGNLSYIHKVVDGRQVVFVGNSSDTAVDVHLRLRGKHLLELWDPHSGRISACESETLSNNEGEVTRVHLKLAPVSSVFLVGGGVRP